MFKFFLLILCLLFSLSIVSFFDPLYCTNQELSVLCSNKIEGNIKFLSNKDKRRLAALNYYKSNLFWHLSDSLMSFDQNKNDQGVVEDILIQDSKKVRIVAIEPAKNTNCFNLQKNSHAGIKFKKRKSFLSSLTITPSSFDLFLKSNPLRVNFFEDVHIILTINTILQLAPQNVEIIIILVDNSKNISKETFLESLQMAHSLHPDILHLGLKLVGDFDVRHKNLDKNIEKYLQKFSYIVAPSGNDGTCTESYPARLPCVDFSVGSYNSKLEISSFSQYEPGVGPLFVAPGEMVWCKGLLPDNPEYVYIAQSGTSAAAALMTGFLSMILSRFGNIFSKEQLLHVIKRCTIKHKKWSGKVIHGAIHARSCIFCLTKLGNEKTAREKKVGNFFSRRVDEVLKVYMHFEKH